MKKTIENIGNWVLKDNSTPKLWLPFSLLG